MFDTMVFNIFFCHSAPSLSKISRMRTLLCIELNQRFAVFQFQERHASELVFVDASSNMDQHNLKVFIICTHSVAGRHLIWRKPY